jgi:nucleoside-triphosphatase THEP1
MIEEKFVEKRKKPNIRVTGTPGVGKTTFCKLLVEYVPELTYVSVGNRFSPPLIL